MWLDPAETWLARNGLGDPNRRAVVTEESDAPSWSAPWMRPLDPKKQTWTFSPTTEADKAEPKVIPAQKDQSAREKAGEASAKARVAQATAERKAVDKASRAAAEQRRKAAEQARAEQQRQRMADTARRQSEAAARQRAALAARHAAAEARMARIEQGQQRTLAAKVAAAQRAQAAASLARQRAATARLSGVKRPDMPSTAQYSSAKGNPVYTPAGLPKEFYPQGLTSTTQIPRGYGAPTRAAWTLRDGWDSSNYNKWQGPIKEQKIVYGSPIYSGTMSENWGIGRSQQEITRVQRFMSQYGWMDPTKPTSWGGWTDRNTRDGMYKLMADANTAGMTIDEYMKAIESVAPPPSVSNGPGPGPSGPSGYTGPLTVKSRDSSVSLTNLANGKNALRAVMRDELGRDPTDAEIRQYLGKLNAAERKNPTVTETTTTRNKSGSYESSSRIVKEGGVDQNSFAFDWSKEGDIGKEREQFSAAKYFQVIAELTGGA